jgi:hypothetical protein
MPNSFEVGLSIYHSRIHHTVYKYEKRTTSLIRITVTKPPSPPCNRPEESSERMASRSIAGSKVQLSEQRRFPLQLKILILRTHGCHLSPFVCKTETPNSIVQGEKTKKEISRHGQNENSEVWRRKIFCLQS